MIRTMYCCVIIMIIAAATWATPEHEWSRRFGDTGIDLGWSIAVDNQGNVFATGVFRDTVNFGGGDLTSAGSADVFLVNVRQWLDAGLAIIHCSRDRGADRQSPGCLSPV